MIPEFRLVKVTEPYGRWEPNPVNQTPRNTEPFREPNVMSLHKERLDVK